ncbi:beta,beta-carotene 15,15'-dioxygenase-like [Zootermopsis nevadensis]|uniref:Beta,beta-carotene 9',10'-oxygenase n=1 Tax=Zootermopsis nevadensis TaxID=136037 RepID=A0A067RM57_ZOONE|nr:beta,beta-carotene 15,15'-dioxygenase-like [Zootermopsis nevadensis]KDR21650.1 Beta,beta-carotene 9',10'-oxygenase [Zootermopsis nevadensis]
MAKLGELFRSTEEQVTPVEAVVTGQIPEWLKGCFLRLGPGKFDIGDFVMNHWFDGYAVLYKFDIQKGKVTFTKRFLQSDAYKKAVAVGRPVFTEFGTKSYPDPCKNIFSRMMSSLVPELTDNGAINVFTMEDAVYVASETNFLRRVDVESLATMEKVDMTKLVGVNLASSHTYQDSRGLYYSMGTSLLSGPKYHIIRTAAAPSGKAQDALSKAAILTTIPSSWTTNMCYYHSFGMSENYIVFIEQPLIISSMKLVTSQVKGKCLRDCMTWNPQELNKFYVIEKSTGKILPVKYKSKNAFFLFHHINTYEENDQLVVDVVAFDSPDIIDKLFLKKVRNNEMDPKDPGCGNRFVLPLPKDKMEFPSGTNLVTLKTKAKAERVGDVIELTPQILSDPGYDLPVVSNNVFGKKYRYYYCSGMYDPGPFSNSLIKVDVETGDAKTWKESEYMYPGEVQFVPCPGSSSEDDGILLAAVTDVRKGEPDFLLVLDAKNLTEVARAEVTVHIPNVIHGLFLPSS